MTTATLTREKLVRNDLLYHSAHGLCRVDRVTKESHAGKEVVSYDLVPNLRSRTKVRFMISDDNMEISGFHPIISVAEANLILDYLKKGDATASPASAGPEIVSAYEQSNHPWGLAKGILMLSRHELEIRDQKKRQILERSARGLVEEFSLVFKTTAKDASHMILKSLGNRAKINPLVLLTLESNNNT